MDETLLISIKKRTGLSLPMVEMLRALNFSDKTGSLQWNTRRALEQRGLVVTKYSEYDKDWYTVPTSAGTTVSLLLDMLLGTN